MFEIKNLKRRERVLADVLQIIKSLLFKDKTSDAQKKIISFYFD
jgi:hypothetical protein